MELRVLFQDDAILAVSKPPGLKVHGGDFEPSLERLVSEQAGRRLILLHRLDQETTGIVLFAKRKDIAGEFSRAFEEKRVRKAYFAVVEGRWPSGVNRVESVIERDGIAKAAFTTFRVLAARDEKTWLEAMPKTGRRHQIRLHCAAQGHPVCGDKLYGQVSDRAGLALHAYRVDFRHPVSGANVRIQDPPPEDWHSTWLEDFDEQRILGPLFP